MRNGSHDVSERMLEHGQEQVNRRWQEYEEMAMRSADRFAADARP